MKAKRYSATSLLMLLLSTVIASNNTELSKEAANAIDVITYEGEIQIMEEAISAEMIN